MSCLLGAAETFTIIFVSIEGKVILVTGGARHLGRAIVEELAGCGARLAIHYHRSREEAAKLQAVFPQALVYAADLRVADDCAALIEAVRQHFGTLDGLVNSAASYARGPFTEETDATWQNLLELNLIAPARLARLGLPLGLSSIVNLLDVAARQPWRNHSAYAASKAGLLQLTLCLARELAPRVRVNAIAPGTVGFPQEIDEPTRQSIMRAIPLGHIGAPSDVARATRFLLEEEFITGVVLNVDGGAGLR